MTSCFWKMGNLMLRLGLIFAPANAYHLSICLSFLLTLLGHFTLGETWILYGYHVQF
jgi:hypothetical protein